MREKAILSTLFVLLGLASCKVNSKEAIGLYVSKHNVNTIDSLWIHENGSYTSLMFRKKENSIIYKNTGKWEISEGYITLHDFFSDEDEVHSQEFFNYENILMTTKLPLERKNGRIIIHHKAMYDDVFLEKIE